MPDADSEEPFMMREAPALYVPVEVRNFASPIVLWLNSDYWLRNGVDVADPVAKESLERWLLDRYAVTRPSPQDPPSLCAGPEKRLYADRYGGAFGTAHGGSGRTATHGNYHAKGIGITPLCDTRVDWSHSHGSLWMEEAIRETIYSLLASYEFPFGANPVVALIDSGANYYHPPEDDREPKKGGRRAILVRPAALRIAHLERSIFFGSSGTATSDQYLDAMRVRQVVNAAFGEAARLGTADELITEMFIRIAVQMGHGRAHRLHHGDYISSNLCLNGELLDFGGGFRIVQDWTASRWMSGTGHFGREYENLGPSIRTVLHQYNKYSPIPSGVGVADLLARMKAATDRTFREELEGICEAVPSDFPNLGSTLAEWLVEEFHQQQTIVKNSYDHSAWMAGNRWIYRRLTGEEGTSSGTGARVREALLGESGTNSDRRVRAAAYARIVRWAKPRIRGTREGIGRIIWYILHKLDYQRGRLSPSDARVVSQLIDAATASLRRTMPGLPATAVVMGRAHAGSSQAWLYRDALSDHAHARLEGISSGGKLRLFGAEVLLSELEHYAPMEGRYGRMSVTVPIDTSSAHKSQLCRLGPADVEIPQFSPRI